MLVLAAVCQTGVMFTQFCICGSSLMSPTHNPGNALSPIGGLQEYLLLITKKKGERKNSILRYISVQNHAVSIHPLSTGCLLSNDM